MNRRFLMAGGGVVLAVIGVIVMMAWMMGGTQPMRWIEQPVSMPPSGAPAADQ